MCHADSSSGDWQCQCRTRSDLTQCGVLCDMCTGWWVIPRHILIRWANACEAWYEPKCLTSGPDAWVGLLQDDSASMQRASKMSLRMMYCTSSPGRTAKMRRWKRLLINSSVTYSVTLTHHTHPQVATLLVYTLLFVSFVSSVFQPTFVSQRSLHMSVG